MTVGVTLVGIRERIEELAETDGAYYVVCGRTGHRPVPVADKRFGDRAAARRAVSAATEYRAALRRYDPEVPHYDLIVCQARGRRTTEPGHDCSGAAGAQQSLSAPIVTGTAGGDAGGRDRLVERCHRVAAATFESLSDCGHREVERATMERYTELAEALPTPDGLCLCLLESMAGTLAERLDGTEQAAVLTRAAERLGTCEGEGDPVTATFAGLVDCDVVGEFSPRERAGPGDAATPDVATVRFSEYALSPREGHLPVLPIVVDLVRRLPDRVPTRVQVDPLDDGWCLELAFEGGNDPEGLLNAPIRSPA
jgi:hypothetical protein